MAAPTSGVHAGDDLSDRATPLSGTQLQDRIDWGEIPGVSTTESAELRAARRRIRELETELLIVRQAAKFLGEDRPAQKALPGDRPTRRRGIPAGRCCRVLGVARQNY